MFEYSVTKKEYKKFLRKYFLYKKGFLFGFAAIPIVAIINFFSQEGFVKFYTILSILCCIATIAIIVGTFIAMGMYVRTKVSIMGLDINEALDFTFVREKYSVTLTNRTTNNEVKIMNNEIRKIITYAGFSIITCLDDSEVLVRQNEPLRLLAVAVYKHNQRRY